MILSNRPIENLMNIKAIIYARVSSKEQEETGYSLDAQEKSLKEYGRKRDFDIEKVFKISESASGKQIRKTFYEMLDFIRKDDINIILCEKIDRLTRNLKDAAVVNDWIQESEKHEVHFVKENFIVNKNTRAHENLVWDMKVAIARFYTNNLSEEVKKGYKEKLDQGWRPTKPLYGFKSVGEKGHRIHVIDPNEAPFVKQAFNYYSTANYSLKVVGKKLYEEGMRTRIGGRPSKSRIEDMLREPFYYGAIPWKGEILPNGSHEPLITKELFDKVQDILTRKKAPKYQKHNFKFKKLITCGECGGSVTAEIQKGIVYYHCSHYKSCSQKKYTKEEKIESQLMGVFRFFENITPDEA